jgi:hypothetical protein
MLGLQVWHLVLTAIVLLFLGGFIGGRIAIVLSLVRSGKEQDHDVAGLLDRAAEDIATLPLREWADWSTYLLRALEDKAQQEEEYTWTLETIRDRVNVRLQHGRWTTR